MMEHHYSHRREKSSLKRFLTWLTFLSLTSFFFHPDGMIWIILHWSLLQTQHLLHNTVELCGYDTDNSVTLLWAALGWLTSALLSALYLLHKLFPVKQVPVRAPTPVDSGFDFSHLKGCKKTKRKEKKLRAIYLSQRDPLSPISSPRVSTTSEDFCYTPPSHYASPIPSPKKIAQARQPEVNLTLHTVPKPITSTTEIKLQDSDSNSKPALSPFKSNEQKIMEATLPDNLSCNPVFEPECSPIADSTPLEYQSPVEEPLPLNEEDEVLAEELIEASDNNETCGEIVDEIIDDGKSILIEKDIEVTPEAPPALNKAELFAFLRDPKTTAPAIRHNVASGLIDGDMVLSMRSSEFAEAKVSQLAARMLLISVMSSRENRFVPTTPTFNRAVMSPPSRVPPPPGFSAINNAPTNDYYRSGAHRIEEPVKNSLDMNHQYERDMELISNQMTMNVLD
ncbi:hypothetical protein THRCLA_20373 [Thraustotheca clavata]|uniref:Uncharacterized protein n=1 Tax=Thraustotheca clavata TaxID=74557 RepID=A0A1W0A886_9STRA|nr:hypothetical protein THRCLA_20373 [Thraustotheca clavata]